MNIKPIDKNNCFFIAVLIYFRIFVPYYLKLINTNIFEKYEKEIHAFCGNGYDYDCQRTGFFAKW